MTNPLASTRTLCLLEHADQAKAIRWCDTPSIISASCGKLSRMRLEALEHHQGIPGQQRGFPGRGGRRSQDHAWSGSEKFRRICDAETRSMCSSESPAEQWAVLPRRFRAEYSCAGGLVPIFECRRFLSGQCRRHGQLGSAVCPSLEPCGTSFVDSSLHVEFLSLTLLRACVRSILESIPIAAPEQIVLRPWCAMRASTTRKKVWRAAQGPKLQPGCM